MKLHVRLSDGSREYRDALVPAPALRTALEEARAKGVTWEIERNKDGLRVQRPVGSVEQLEAYAKANPFSWTMFQQAERVCTQERDKERGIGEVWEWVLPDGSIVESLVNDIEEIVDAGGR